MTDPHGETLFVNLAAAAARRRLQGFGHGVRKIHSAGRNQAAIIHTATGKHLEQLKAKFADVGCSDRQPQLEAPLNELDVAPRFVDDEHAPPKAR